MSLDTLAWTKFHFLRPWWFLALIPLAWVIWRMTKQTMSQKGWAGVIDEALLPYVLISKELQSRSWSKVLVGLTGILSVIALAGPVWQQLPQPVYRNNAALVIALDLSRSMDAGDLKPSRLARARFKIADLLKQRKEGQTALLVYANDAYTVTPLTDDKNTILSQLKALTTDLMPQQGSRADRAMMKASDLLKQAGVRNGDILLITDGVNRERDSTIATEMKKNGHRVHVFGIGTKEGAPIPNPQGGYFTDASENIVLPVLEEASLKAVAKAGEGLYKKYTIDDRDVNRLILQWDKKSIENGARDTELKSDQWREEGPWLLLLILPFAAFAFRQGYLVLLVFFMTGFSYSPETMAKDLWQRPDQKAQVLLQQGEAKKAAELFDDLEWKASAHYQAGNYEEAMKSWGDRDDAETLYNKGNALAKMGKFEEALDSYKRSLQDMPDHDDAQYNYDQVKKVLEEQQKQEQQEGDQKKEPEQGEGDQDKEGEQSENSSGDDQQPPQEKKQDKENEEDQSDQQNKPGQQQEGEDPASAEQQTDQDKQNEEQEREMKQGESDSSSDESQQAVEAALRAIPDDPGGLLRRKFKYQYQQRASGRENEEQQW